MSKHKFIEVKGARVHNLKSLSVKIPHGKMTVITGLSGSGKSSLAFDTLYAEGQRRYIESLSSYARQFLGKLNKPETDYIKGISPAVAIEQKVISSNPRSTVGTTTEIYDYLKILFSRIGKTYSPISGNEVKKHSVSDVVDHLRTFKEGTRAFITCPIVGFQKYGVQRQLDVLKQQGYTRILLHKEVLEINDCITDQPADIEYPFPLLKKMKPVMQILSDLHLLKVMVSVLLFWQMTFSKQFSRIVSNWMEWNSRNRTSISSPLIILSGLVKHVKVSDR
jgi:excinuclease ABC subunit A